MPITNQDFIQAAREILSSGKSEIDFRNATSRAYYAAYHAATKFKSRAPQERGRGGIHSQLIDDLKRNQDKRIKQVGYLLNQCRVERTDADYGLDLHFDRHRAENVIELVAELLSLSNQIS